MDIRKVKKVGRKGGPGSGDFGHSGRQGEVGGSGSGGDEGRWTGFGSVYAQQLIAYENKLNRKPYVPLTTDEVEQLQAIGYLTSRRNPKITDEGYREIQRARQVELEDIRREAREVGLSDSGLIIHPDKNGKQLSNLFTKTTTATDWLNDNPDDMETLDDLVEASGLEGFGILTEMPEAMKERIADLLKESFSQDYWETISETTGGAAERILLQGLDEGWSIRDMAKELREKLGGDEYARARANNIARTEAKAACNGSRKECINQVQEDMGDKISVRPVWISVLGPTTREEHADLDGVPADKDGMWNLAGMMIPYPGHYSLGPEQRCNCQCSIFSELGMDEDEAREEISDYYERQSAQGEEPTEESEEED